jgi:cation transport regulator
VLSGAIEQYQNPEKRHGRKKQSEEEIAHKTAWAAVEKEYEKKGSKWVRKGEWLGSFHNQ